jgi:hypothetical protein
MSFFKGFCMKLQRKRDEAESRRVRFWQAADPEYPLI